ncbi:DUF4158 domain-containing protein [Streptomyces sp. NPDC020802]|uniref:DUF4158 domain-containing protein n=1 Tax=Streptomyces sp. NPDC020802 TaxID=3365094 RepID=UPI0037A3B9C3
MMLKSYQRMGCFPALEDVPEQVVEFVRRQVDLPEGTLPLYRAERTAKHHRGLVRKKVGVKYDQGEARRIVERSIRKEAAAKNQSADLINIALEKVVEAGLEVPGFSTFDKMASKICTEVNASIREGIHDRVSPVERAGPGRAAAAAGGARLGWHDAVQPVEVARQGAGLAALQEPGQAPGVGRRHVGVDGVGGHGEITDFAGETDAAELRDYAPIKQIALIACLRTG